MALAFLPLTPFWLLSSHDHSIPTARIITGKGLYSGGKRPVLQSQDPRFVQDRLGIKVTPNVKTLGELRYNPPIRRSNQLSERRFPRDWDDSDLNVIDTIVNKH